MKFFAALLGICTIVATSAQAGDPSALKSLISGNDSRGWEAVGRIDIAGQAFCTGALIAPDLVLTAAHCLFDKDDGRPFTAGEIEFLAGWRNGRANAYRDIRRVLPHPKFEFQSSDRIARIAYDVALLQLAQPVRNTSVRPFSTGERPRKGAEVGVVSYAQDRAESPSLQEVCHVLARQSGTLLLSCEVDFGSSGAPIFSLDDQGEAQIVSVISAKADVRGRSVALGTSLEQPLDDLLALISQGDVDAPAARPVAHIMKMNRTRNGAGAKFLRP